MKHGNHNSLPFYWDLFERVYHDVVSSLVSVSERERDLAYAKSRYEDEGISFFTIVLPKYGKALDRALSNTDVPFSVMCFKKHKNTQIPSFLGTLVRYLFTDTGVCRPAGPTDTSYCRETAASALRGLRQLLYLFYKLELPYTEDQKNEVIKNFINSDLQINDGPQTELKAQTLPAYPAVLRLARTLIHSVLCNADPFGGNPKHGPGSVATGETPVEKHVFKRYYRALARQYDYGDWFFYNYRHLVDDLQDYLSLEELEAGTAKVVLVPKDSRGPRLISCEPLEYQWIQQAQLGTLVKCIESHPLTKGLVNFTDQSVNRRLSLSSSADETMVTLDMKEASDRVAVWHVKHLFPKNWVDALLASRSTATRLPSGEIFALKKFAPMGSAVCFPVEALIFWAVSTAALIVHDARNNLALQKHVKKDRALLPTSDLNAEVNNLVFKVNARGRTNLCSDFLSVEQTITADLLRSRFPVFVYGDDIICAVDNHDCVIQYLEAFDFKVNTSKCCTKGPFRESCGCDAYKGIDVTPVRFRTVVDARRAPSTFVKLVGFSNEAYAKGLVGTAFWLEKKMRNHFRGWPLPVVSNDDPSCLALIRPGLLPYPGPGGKTRFNTALHKPEVSGLATQLRLTQATVEGFPLMLREEYKRCGDIASNSSRAPTGAYPLERRVTLKRSWTAFR